MDFLEDEMQSYEEFKDFTQLIYQSDRTQKRSVERWVENVVLSSVDMAEIVLASQKVRAPDKYREILKSLSFLNGFDKEIADKLGEFARLRNIITHEYLDIRWRQIQEFIKTLEIPAADSKILLELTPASYLGNASEQAKNI